MSAHATVPADLVSGAHPDTQEGREVFRKVIWRIVPFLTVALIFNNMDRTNVGFAALTMNRDLGLTASQFGLGAGILFASLCALEIPSNLALHRFGAPRWMARVMISWGILAAATAFVVGPYSFYIVRFLLGAAEAGFFPGVIYIFATWFPANYRTRIYAWFLLSSPLAATISGPLSAAILPMDGFLGLAGWSWMLLLQGLPVVFLGLMCPWILANKPEDAVWLTPEERATAVRVLAAEKRNDPVESMWAAMVDKRVLMLSVVIFGFLLGSYGLGVWLPLILKGHDLTNTRIGLLSSVPFLVGCVALIVWAQLIDRGGRRLSSLTIACLLSAAGFIISLLAPTMLVVAYGGLSLAVIGITVTRGLFWSIPPRVLQGVAAAGGIAFINTIGTFGGFLGPASMGWLKDLTGSFSTGLAFMAGILLLSGILSFCLRFVMPQE